jgi:demethylmenaquinone methyltransferase/2-methoxy-6-polyprenyl-1,4-benzoquinol methylase
MTTNPESNWFGNRRVNADEKYKLVQTVFENVAPKYDLMNDLMSGGMHRLWKDRLVRMIRPRAGLSYLDVAGGTGDIAFRIREKMLGKLETWNVKNFNYPKLQRSNIPITICDINPAMLDVGKDRAIDRGWIDGFEWITGNAESLPFPDQSFDVYTIAFGLRNVPHIDTALNEAARVLKPGGRFYCLEFSQVTNPILKGAYDLYSSAVIPKMGAMIAGDSESYQYLIESIRKFPNAPMLARRMANAGFSNAKYVTLSAGIVAIHSGIRA